MSFICYDLSDLSKYAKSHFNPDLPAIKSKFARTIYFYFTCKQGSSKNSEK